MKPIDTPAAVEEYTGIPATTLAQWRYLKKGPSFIKQGRMIRYRKADVDRWLDENTVKVGSDAA